MALYTYDYDFSYSPSAPVAEIEVTNDVSNNAITLMAFIDSGADATMLPFTILQQLPPIHRQRSFLDVISSTT